MIQRFPVMEVRQKSPLLENSMKKPTTKAGKAKKVEKVMREFKEGTLHSGKGGKVVTNPKQGIAIALSETGVSKKKKK